MLRASWQNQVLESSSNFEPIPELRPADSADVTLFFLSANSVLFVERALDPWYRATRPAFPITIPGTGTRADVYSQDEPASPLACTWQEQFCGGGGGGGKGPGGCTPLGTASDARDGLGGVFPDEAGLRRVIWSARALWGLGNDPYTVASTLNAGSLVSRKTLWGGLQGPLPDDQWKLDMQYWFEVGLAAVQQAMVDTALGEPESAPADFLVRPSADEETRLCSSQVSRSPYPSRSSPVSR